MRKLPIAEPRLSQVEARGLDIVGIYRLCGSAVRKRMLREAIERSCATGAWKVDLSAEQVPDINVVTSELTFLLADVFCLHIPRHHTYWEPLYRYKGSQ